MVQAFTHMRMGVFTMASGKKIKKAVKVSLPKLMETAMKVIGKMTKGMGMESKSMQMATSMTVNGMKIKELARVH